LKANWRRQKEAGTPSGMRLIRWIALRLGRSPARLILWPVALYFYLRKAEYRRISRRYLSRALGRKTHWWNIIRHIHTFAATVLDRVYFLTDQFHRFHIRLFNNDMLHQLTANTQGCLLLGAHLGSFEVLRSTAIKYGALPLKVLMYQDQTEHVTRLLEGLNPDIGQTIIPLGSPETLIKVKECIDQGDIIGLLGDRATETDKTVDCLFLGKSARFPVGPILLAHSLKTPVVLFFGLYLGGNRYEIHFELLADRIEIHRMNRKTDVRDWCQRYVDRLEHYTRYAPYNWFNFYDFWNEDQH
jgi:predicted LPLAT superfamily acyltransferase